MLEVAPSEEGEEGHRGHTTSATEAFSKGGIESPSFQGEKRTASEDPEAALFFPRGEVASDFPHPSKFPLFYLRLAGGLIPPRRQYGRGSSRHRTFRYRFLSPL